MVNEIQWIPGALAGFRHVAGMGPDGQVVTFEEGALLALRQGGNEGLFASCGEKTEKDGETDGETDGDKIVEREDKKRPLVWIPIGEFSVNVHAVANQEDILVERGQAQEIILDVPQPGKSPFPASASSIRRRQG